MSKRRGIHLESKQAHQQRIDREIPAVAPKLERHSKEAHNHLVEIDHIVTRIWGHGSKQQKLVRHAIDAVNKL